MNSSDIKNITPLGYFDSELARLHDQVKELDKKPKPLSDSDLAKIPELQNEIVKLVAQLAATQSHMLKLDLKVQKVKSKLSGVL